uniref:Uncharacterized protein n=1 Tax=Amphimedon queenslandica TaxID=400682 RepID=A0A1X7U386_AMPQE
GIFSDFYSKHGYIFGIFLFYFWSFFLIFS